MHVWPEEYAKTSGDFGVVGDDAHDRFGMGICVRDSTRNWFTIVRMLLVSHGISNVTFSPTPKTIIITIIVDAIFSPENVYVTENPVCAP